MKRVTVLSIWNWMLWIAISPLMAEPLPPKIVGRHVPDFVLPDQSGGQVAMSDFNDSRLLVLVFLGTECPIANAYLPVLNDLQSRYSDRGVRVIGINANPADSVEAIARHQREFATGFPVLVDAEQVIADLVGATRTPEVFLLDRKRVIRYRGRIDDRIGYAQRRAEARRNDLEDAITELLEGKKVSQPEIEPEGCLITRRDRLPQRDSISYAKHVSRIVEQRCAGCHHPGTAAPFSLLTYEDVESRSEMIREAVVARRMPPWSADPRHGQFENDFRLTTKEIDTLLAWIDLGKPRGDASELSEPRPYTEGWMIGQPDLVFRMPRDFTVPAAGTVAYQYFVTPTNFSEDVWVQASEAKPGNRSVVHHIIAFVRSKGSKKLQDLPHAAGYAPGEEPMILPDGVGLRIPAGAEIVWQVHYTPNGKEETDCSEVGLVLCKQVPQRPLHGGGAFNTSFVIPAGADRHRVVSSKTFSRDVELLSLMPHMHVRGRDFRYTAHYPDGRSEVLLNVPNYDFNWQHRYRFVRPVKIPKGTMLECVAHFDNSEQNPANPDPAKEVRWGDQTWEEMMIGWYSHVDPRPDTEGPGDDSAAGTSPKR